MLSVRTPTAAASQSFDSAYREIDGLRPLQPLDKIALSVVTGTATPFPASPFPAENVHAAAIRADVIVDQLYALALQVLRQPINHNPNLIAALTMSTLTYEHPNNPCAPYQPICIFDPTNTLIQTVSLTYYAYRKCAWKCGRCCLPLLSL